MLINPMGGRPRSDPQHLENIKSWTVQALKLDEDTTVMVTQLHCTEPGCPPLETVIAVLTVKNAPVQYKIYKSILEVTRQDITDTIVAGPINSTLSTTGPSVKFLKKLSTGLNTAEE